VPLLGADWYGKELSRRYDLLPRGNPDEASSQSLPAGIADRARHLGRPVAAAMSLSRQTRRQLGRQWTMTGMVYVERRQVSASADSSEAERSINIDTVATKAWADRIEKWRAGRRSKPSTDGMDEYALGLLGCPRLSLIPNPNRAQSDSLATLCNRR
jgi:hypothetical protein